MLHISLVQHAFKDECISISMPHINAIGEYEIHIQGYIIHISHV